MKIRNSKPAPTPKPKPRPTGRLTPAVDRFADAWRAGKLRLEMQQQLEKQQAVFNERLQALTSAPPVSVEAPSVSIEPPAVTVEVDLRPIAEAMERMTANSVTTTPDLSPLTTVLQQLAQQQAEAMEMMRSGFELLAEALRARRPAQARIVHDDGSVSTVTMNGDATADPDAEEIRAMTPPVMFDQ